MSLASTMQFEVRPATGSDSQCSGGFNSARGGTDYTQQAAAQATGTASSSGTTVTATTGIFTAAMVGNTITTDGTAANTKEITAFTSSTVVTVDSAPSVAWSAATVYVGGAKASIANVEAMLTGNMVGWIKADGTDQTITAFLTLTNSGDNTNGEITWQGYHTTRGDHDGTRPTIKTSTNNVDLLRIMAANTAGISYRIFDNINWVSTAGTPGNGITASTGTNGQKVTISNCKISGCKTGIQTDNGATYGSIKFLNIINCEITSCTTDGIRISDSAVIDGCNIHNNTGWGINSPQGFGVSTTFRNLIIYANTSGGIQQGNVSGSQGSYTLDHCVIRGNLGDGLKDATSTSAFSAVGIQNCEFYGNSGYGVNFTNPAVLVVTNRNNAYGSNSSGLRNNWSAGTNDVTLTSDPNVNASGGDFLPSSAGMKGAGFPGSIPGLATSGSADIGTLQGQSSPGSIYFRKGGTVMKM